jgi:hypothetical protein
MTEYFYLLLITNHNISLLLTRLSKTEYYNDKNNGKAD